LRFSRQPASISILQFDAAARLVLLYEVDAKVLLDLAQPAEHILTQYGTGNDALVLTGRWIGFDGER
jgi:hypothetical protein